MFPLLLPLLLACLIYDPKKKKKKISITKYVCNKILTFIILLVKIKGEKKDQNCLDGSLLPDEKVMTVLGSAREDLYFSTKKNKKKIVLRSQTAETDPKSQRRAPCPSGSTLHSLPPHLCIPLLLSAPSRQPEATFVSS